MWLNVSDKKKLINLDHVREIHAEPYGGGSILSAIFSDGKVVPLREFKTKDDAESVLTQIKNSLGNQLLTGTAFDH